MNICQEESGGREEGSVARSQKEPAPSPATVPCHMIRVVVSEKLAEEWSFFVKTLRLDLFSSSKLYFEYLAQAGYCLGQ